MEIIKTGEPVSEKILSQLEEKLTDIIECPICKSQYKPDISDLELSTGLKNTYTDTLRFKLTASVKCPICDSKFTRELEDLTEIECIMMKGRGENV